MPAFYLSSLLAFTGGHMVNYAVILYLQEKVGSDLLSGIGFGLSFGTSILFGWFAGVLCDRISPTRVIHAAHLPLPGRPAGEFPARREPGQPRPAGGRRRERT